MKRPSNAQTAGLCAGIVSLLVQLVQTLIVLHRHGEKMYYMYMYDTKHYTTTNVLALDTVYIVY